MVSAFSNYYLFDKKVPLPLQLSIKLLFPIQNQSQALTFTSTVWTG